ncbi:hypothetical protein [Adhaeribacter soli]|nr:hypothetical protein [Adhaeribacter soli]
MTSLQYSVLNYFLVLVSLFLFISCNEKEKRDTKIIVDQFNPEQAGGLYCNCIQQEPKNRTLTEIIDSCEISLTKKYRLYMIYHNGIYHPELDSGITEEDYDNTVIFMQGFNDYIKLNCGGEINTNIKF